MSNETLCDTCRYQHGTGIMCATCSEKSTPNRSQWEPVEGTVPQPLPAELDAHDGSCGGGCDVCPPERSPDKPREG